MSALAVSQRPRVRKAVAGRTVLERGGPELVTGPLVALVAHWSPHAAVTRSVATLVRELQQNGYRVAVSSACEADGPLQWPGEVDVDLDQLTVLRRPNVGYDFGSWSIALEHLPAAASAERTLLVNDSLAGPFASLEPLLDAFARTEADVWGLTDTAQFWSHLQSYLLGFRGGILADKALVRFWAHARCEPTKTRVIQRYELGLSRLLHAEGYLQSPHFPHETVVPEGSNPVIAGWKRLVGLGFPFVKRELLRRPQLAPEGRTIPAVLHGTFGVDVWDWVDEEPFG